MGRGSTSPVGRRRVYLDSGFFYRCESGGVFIFGYHGLRRAFMEALARAMDLVNGREIVGVETMINSSKKCRYHIRTDDGRYRECGKQAEVKLVARTLDGKFFATYYCREHFIEEMETAKKRLVESITSLVDGMIKAIEDGDQNKCS